MHKDKSLKPFLAVLFAAGLGMLSAAPAAGADVTVTLTAPTNGSTHAPSANITLAADASGTQGYSVSKVEFFNGTTLIGTDTSAPYSITWNNVLQGSYTLTAKATAIKNNSPDQTATSSPVNIAVTVPPSVSLTSPTDGAIFGMLENITVSATATDSDGTIAKVTLSWIDEMSFDGGSVTLTEPPYSVVATLNPHPANPGSWDYPVYAFYATATDNNGANVSNSYRSVTVTVGPSVTITSPANGANYSTPATIPLSASVASPNGGGEIERVQFYHGTTLIGEVPNSPYNLSWQNVSAGTYSLTAKAVNWGGSVWTSPAVNVTVGAATASTYFIHVDHLNTPRLVADAAGATVWRWDQAEPFGSNPADENPSGLGAFDLPLRLPGQYFDRETGLHYNYFRDYDPSLGRYGESDPIGLRGGLNTYAYVAGQPLRATDNFGLVKWTGSMTAISVVAGGGATRLSFDLTSECVKGKRGRVKVLAGGFAVGFGATFTGTGSSVEFEDDLSDVDPFVFEGQAKYVSAGLVLGANPDPPAPTPWPTITIGCSALQLGGATSIGCTLDPKGFDASVSGGVGISNVRDAKIECCTQ